MQQGSIYLQISQAMSDFLTQIESLIPNTQEPRGFQAWMQGYGLLEGTAPTHQQDNPEIISLGHKHQKTPSQILENPTDSQY